MVLCGYVYGGSMYRLYLNESKIVYPEHDLSINYHINLLLCYFIRFGTINF